jgi:hypothetical protein
MLAVATGIVSRILESRLVPSSPSSYFQTPRSINPNREQSYPALIRFYQVFGQPKALNQVFISAKSGISRDRLFVEVTSDCIAIF